jgi:membrane associated rhomboid family serine protease
MIPISTDTPVRRTPWVNYALIGTNVALFLALGGLGHPTALGRRLGGSLALEGTNLEIYQFFTYQFIHADWAHIGGNMLFLWIFGNAVNSKMGHGLYLLFYLAGGIMAAVGYAWANPDFSGMLGASGAIAAVTTAYLALFPRSHVTILYWWFIIGTFELPSMILIVFKMILWDNIMAPRMVAGESSVAFDAHLAGYAFGFSASVALLAIRVLPRDQFDILALGQRWFRRQTMRNLMQDPEARARAQFGRVARPVSIQDVQVTAPGTESRDQIAGLRMKISEALALNDRDSAADMYEKLMELDPRQVLPRTSQLDVANHLYTLHHVPQAAAAYEKLLATYPTAAEAPDIKLLLGIIYARDLKQYEVAEGHLRQSLQKISDTKRLEQCRHWLNVVAEALGRPMTDGSDQGTIQ